ncbi:LysR family transcriptional regulator [Pigmentiphaga sp. GD03639]|uniref:LysR substrate-binding domain-containing protein n=1 Tax=Pigmentiphaga daeguensis TaxID=414049 RepID=A0ABN1CL31_9BURK|nr:MULTISPECIES: LysR family transcriptional regulator [unclassified Pigmentiphaga]MDH2238123.1 LysR family transcriptional regulator [Pigmentiphaga sp. GD03639]OVZ65955.1 LysR family transcriptional regulator [Pigmentiphaga sp. NML030171]
MNLIWLEDFLVLAECGNFSRAAELRHMTQPAFSRRIRMLEEWLGVTLFDRATHPVTLTETGLWFRTTAQDMLARVERIPDEARRVAQASSATLRFAATHALSLTFLPDWLRGLESGLSLGPIQLVSDVAQQCEALMTQGRAQFFLCHAHEQAPARLDASAYPSIKVGDDVLLPVCAPDRQGRPRFVLGGTSGKRVPILAYSAESGLGRIVRAVHGAALARLRADVAVTAHLATVLQSMARSGRGVAWLPASLVRDELGEGKLMEAGEPSWRIELDIRLYRRGAAEPAAAEAFWRAAGAGTPGPREPGGIRSPKASRS